MAQNVYMRSGSVCDLVPSSGVTTTTSITNTGWKFKDAPLSAIQATVTGTGAVSATIVIYGSNDGVNAVSTSLGSITLSGTTSSSDGFITNAPWKYIQAIVTAISGTGASVNVTQCS
jgi:hypothetical protein